MKDIFYLTVIILVLTVQTSFSYRMSKPSTFRDPLTQEQISDLNESLESIRQIVNGRIELDIVTSQKTGADEGEVWIYNNAGTYSLSVKSGSQVRSVALTP